MNNVKAIVCPENFRGATYMEKYINIHMQMVIWEGCSVEVIAETRVMTYGELLNNNIS